MKFSRQKTFWIERGAYQERIYPINRKGGEILGLNVYPSLSEVPQWAADEDLGISAAISLGIQFRKATSVL